MTDDVQAVARLRDQGVRPMPGDRALAVLESVLADGAATAVVADVDWARFTETFTALRRRPLLDALPGARAADAAPGEPAAGSALRDRLTGRPASEQHHELAHLVRSHAAAVLGHEDVRAVAVDTAFRELGFDSLGAVRLRKTPERRHRARSALDPDLRPPQRRRARRPPAHRTVHGPDDAADTGGPGGTDSVDDAVAAALGGLDRLRHWLGQVAGPRRAEVARHLDRVLTALRSGPGHDGGSRVAPDPSRTSPRPGSTN
ncbi:beta-ketoacyl reductase [Streptomyces sp. KL116D]|uniref:acyl carrier protein n=1 Tax=Streptomyces sp. KL116D TaxID=3045152 RepID=UPI003558DE95